MPYFEHMKKNLTAPKQDQTILEIPGFRRRHHLKSQLICQHCILWPAPKMLLDNTYNKAMTLRFTTMESEMFSHVLLPFAG